MGESPTVRVAGHEDVRELVRLIGAFRDFLGASAVRDEQIAETVPVLLDHPDTELALAWVDVASPAVGYTQLRVLPSLWEDGREAYLEDIFVEERMRGSGVGAALLEHALRRARRLGATAIALATNERNEASQAFYTRRGFRPAGEARWGGGREIRWVRALDRE